MITGGSTMHVPKHLHAVPRDDAGQGEGPGGLLGVAHRHLHSGGPRALGRQPRRLVHQHRQQRPGPATPLQGNGTAGWPLHRGAVDGG